MAAPVHNLLENNMTTHEPNDEEELPKCPICRTVAGEECEHIVSTWDYMEDGGIWAGDSSQPDAIPQIVEEIFQNLESCFTQTQMDLIGQLLRLPRRLAEPLGISFAGEGLDTSGWNAYLADLVTESPGYIGSASCELGGGGMSSDVAIYWAKDRGKCGKWLDRELRRDIKTLKDLKKLAKDCRKSKS